MDDDPRCTNAKPAVGRVLQLAGLVLLALIPVASMVLPHVELGAVWVLAPHWIAATLLLSLVAVCAARGMRAGRILLVVVAFMAVALVALWAMDAGPRWVTNVSA